MAESNVIAVMAENEGAEIDQLDIQIQKPCYVAPCTVDGSSRGKEGGRIGTRLNGHRHNSLSL